MDLDGDGRLSKKEIEKALGNVLSEADFNELLTELDADQSGEVDWQEFVNVMKIRMREPESVKMLKEAFRWEWEEICFAASNQSKFNRFEGGKVFSTLFGKSTMFQALAKKISPKDWRKKKESELDLHLKAGKTSMYYVSVLLSNWIYER